MLVEKGFCLVKVWGCRSGRSLQGWEHTEVLGPGVSVLSLSHSRYHPQNCHLSPCLQFPTPAWCELGKP